MAVATCASDLGYGRHPHRSQQPRGEAIEMTIFEASGQTRIGRFGWKDQHDSLLSFIGEAIRG